MKIEIEELSRSLIEEYAKWSEEKSEKAMDLTKKIGNEMVEKIKEDSPKDTGKYKKGWKAKVTLGKGFCKIKGANTARPEITHLLENGHSKVNGGRTKPYPHIIQNEKDFNKKLVEEIEGLFE